MGNGTTPPLKSSLQDDLLNAATKIAVQESAGPPQGQGSSLQQDLDRVFGPIAEQHLLEAEGFWENLKWQTVAGTKAVADGVANMASGAARVGSQLIATNPLFGESTWDAWDRAGAEFDKGNELAYGTATPDSVDLMASVARQLGYNDVDPRSVDSLTAGQNADRIVRQKLGDMAVLGESAGVIASFATAPGSFAGKVGAGAAAPMAKMAERQIAKRLRKSVAGTPAQTKAIEKALKSGRPLHALSALPEWKKLASRQDRIMAWGGRHISDMMTTTGSLVAQSYALGDPGHRGEAAQMALLTGPAIVPIARIGQRLGSRIAAAGMSRDQKVVVESIFRDLASGKIKPSRADELLGKVLKTNTRTFLGNTVAAAFEGGAFPFLHKETWNDLSEWMDPNGDPDAGARLVATMLGSIGGILTAKYAVPHDLAPMFAHVRPGLNNIRLRAEAEAARVEPEAYSAPIGPQQLHGPEAPRYLQRDLPFDRPQAPAERIGGPRQALLPFEAREFEKRVAAGEDPAVARLEIAAGRYDWANEATRPLFSAGFEARFPEFGKPVIEMSLGDRHSFVIKGGREDLVLEMRSDTAEVLSEFGHEIRPQDRQAERDGVFELTGDPASAALDALALIGMFRQMSGTMNYERVGFRETQSPGRFADDSSQTYHTIGLDGKTQMRSIEGVSRGEQELFTAGGMTRDPSFSSPGLDVFKDAIMAKKSTAPEELIDSVIDSAIMMAEHSDSLGGRALREFFEKATSPGEAAALMAPGNAKYVAKALGSLGAGRNNATTARNEMNAAVRQGPRAPAGSGPTALRIDLTAAIADPQRNSGLNKLYEQFKAGDDQAGRMLQDYAEQVLIHNLLGLDVPVSITRTQGVKQGQTEPSIRADLDVPMGTDPSDVAAAVARTAKVLGQESVTVRARPEKGSKLGDAYPDGSENSMSYRIELDKRLTPKQAERMVRDLELEGLSIGGEARNVVEHVFVPKRTNDPTAERARFLEQTERLLRSLGKRVKRVSQQAERIWNYGSEPGAIPYERATDVGRLPRAPEWLGRDVPNRNARAIGERFAGRELALREHAKPAGPEVAQAYKEMPTNNLGDPVTRRAYEALATEAELQVETIPARIEVYEGKGEPYRSQAEMREDVLRNNHLFVTRQPRPEGHPLAKTVSVSDVNGQPLNAAEALRAAHDYYAHTMGSGETGDTAAWISHMSMTRDPMARWALTTETLGRSTSKESKTALMPIEHTLTGDVRMDTEMKALQGEVPTPAPAVAEKPIEMAAKPETADTMGVETESDVIARSRLSRMASMAEKAGDIETSERMKSILKTGTRDDVVAEVEAQMKGSVAGSAPVVRSEVLVKAYESAKKAGKSMADWFMTDRVEMMERALPGDPTVAAMREARSRQRKLYGEAQSKMREAESLIAGALGMGTKLGRRMQTVVTVDGQEMFRWVALAEGRIQPADGEAVVAKQLNEAALVLWEAARAAGVRRLQFDHASGEFRYQTLSSRDRTIIPRMPGADHNAVFEDPALRRQFFQKLIDLNGLTKPDGKGGKRPMTAEEMNKEWLDKQSGAKLTSAEREAAFEFVRELRNYPAMWRGNVMLESNPLEGMRRLMWEQSGRTAVVETWGQDLPAKARAAIERAEGVTLPPGAASELAGLQARLVDAGHRRLSESASDVMITMQGGSPSKMSPMLQALAPVEGFIRSGMTMITGIHDVPAPIVQGTAYAGWRRMTRALAYIAKSGREGLVAAERSGSLFRSMTTHDFRDSLSRTSGRFEKMRRGLQTVSDMMSYLSTAAEHVKTAAFDRMAVEMMTDWSSGRVTNNDRGVLREMLKFTPQEVDSLTSGKASEALRDRFRHEFVKLTTGRRTKVEGSQFLANPNLTQIIRFGNWISGRMVELARNFNGVVAEGRTPSQRAQAAKRLTMLASGWTVSGMATTAIYYLIQDLFKGDPDGLARYYNELTHRPWQTLAKGLEGQIIGGPVAMSMRAIGNTDEPRSWAQLTTPTSYLYAIGEAFEEVTKPDSALGMAKALVTDAPLRLASESGLSPSLIRNAAMTVGAAIAGQDLTYRNDARAVSQWKRLEGIEVPQFVRTKSAEFYDALAGLRKAVRGYREGTLEERVDRAISESGEDLRKALGLSPSDSLAASIRTFQILDNLTVEQKTSLSDFFDDAETMKRIYAHDMVVREFAKAVGRMHGEEQTAFEIDLSQSEGQAALGDATVWRPLVDRVMEGAIVRLESNQSIGSEIQQAAEAMAAYPHQLSSVFTERQIRALTQRGVGLAWRADMIANLLRRRAYSRLQDLRREEAQGQ